MAVLFLLSVLLKLINVCVRASMVLSQIPLYWVQSTIQEVHPCLIISRPQIRSVALDTGQVFLTIRVFVNLIRPRVRDPFRFVLLRLGPISSWVGFKAQSWTHLEKTKRLNLVVLIQGEPVVNSAIRSKLAV